MPQISAFPISNPLIDVQPVPGTSRSLLPQYLETFTRWITAGSVSLSGLDLYPHASFCHGTVQAFDHFFLKHHARRLRFFKGEFMYHQVCLRNSIPWCFIEDAAIDSNDAVIISCPFSDFGDTHPDMLSILNICDQANVPVLIDMAYLCIGHDLTVDLEHDCIETVTTSLSKSFDGAQFWRAGIRWQKKDLDDGIDFFNKNFQVPTHSLACALDYMLKYTIDHNWILFGHIYEMLIRDLDLEPTKCILFALGDDRYREFNRGSQWNRVCLSKELGEQYASMQSQ